MSFPSFSAASVAARRVLCLLLVFTWMTPADAQIRITLLPDSIMLPIMSASPSAHRISVQKLTDRNNYFGSMGSYRPLASGTAFGFPVEVGLGASMHTTLRKSPGHWQVIETGFFIDVTVDAEIIPGTVIRVGRGHTSQHLADDAFELLGFKESVNYVRDYFSGHIIQQVPLINGFVYAGTFNNYVFRIDSARPDTWSFQCGTDLLNMPVGPDTYLYAAADLYLHTELRNGTSQNYQAGIKYAVASKRAFRLAYNYRTGLEYRGQFFRNHLTVHTVGFYVDY